MICRKIIRRILKHLPQAPLFDRLHNLIFFVYSNHRLPKKEGKLFNDYLYFLKNSQDITDIYRQVTSDKILVKDYVASKIGANYTPKTYGIYSSVDEVDLNKIEFSCVLKPAHGNGSVIFCSADKQSLTGSERETLQAALKTSPYLTQRERNYMHLRKRLICEEMLPAGKYIKDYKVFCYNGVAKAIQVNSGRQSTTTMNIYDRNWVPIDIYYNSVRGSWEDKPKNFDELLTFAEILSNDFEFVRVDFFLSGNRIFVGELTHLPNSTHGKFGCIDDEKKFSNIIFS